MRTSRVDTARVIDVRVAMLACSLFFSVSSIARAEPPCAGVDKCPLPAAYESARGVALGTGVRASAISTSALAYTPAALALGRLYQIEGLIDYMPEIKTVALGGGVVDSSTAKVGAGIGLRGFLSGDQGYDGLDGRLGLAFPFAEGFAVGLLGRYITLSREVPDGDDLVDEELAEGFTMDASIRLTPSQAIQIDLGAQNFVDLGTPYAPVLLTGSVAIAAAQTLSLGADVLTDMSSFDDPGVTVGGGVEFLGGQSVPLRGGYSADLKREVHAFGVGIGYIDRQVSLDVSLKQELKGGDATRILFAMRYHVN